MDSPQQSSKAISKRAPILHLDVHIGDGVTKDLYIYDLDSATVQATNFAAENNLSEKKLQTLLTVMKQELQSTLTRIDEEDED